jgi:predicted hotdog family 3-hydroxylacyl-ACP dehydratase
VKNEAMTVAVYPPLERLLPHHPPMILIDRLLEANEQETVCEVTITPESMFLEAAGVPAFVGLEYLAQSIAARIGYQHYLAHEPITVGLLMGTHRLETGCQFFELGQTLRIHVAHVWGTLELRRFRCTMTSASIGIVLQHAELHICKPKNVQSYLEEVGHDHTRTH